MSKVGRLIEEYRRLTRIIGRAEGRRGKIKSALKAYMERKGQDEIRVGDLKALRYETRKIKWDVETLATLLEHKGVPEEIVKHIFPTVVNEHAVMQLVEDGIISMEDVHRVAKVHRGWSFRVDDVKEP